MTHTPHSVLIGEADGHFYVASTESPYFCFQAESEESAVMKARSAYSFYRDHAEEVPSRSSRTFTITALSATKRVNIAELEAA